MGKLAVVVSDVSRTLLIWDRNWLTEFGAAL